jgi:hypothetical protein
VKERPLVLIYSNWNECQKFRREHGLGLRPAEMKAENMRLGLMGHRDFDFMLVDTALAPELEAELERRGCTHVVPVTRWRYRIADAIANAVEWVFDRMMAFLDVPRTKRVRVMK